MTPARASLTGETNSIRAIYAALNRNDIPAVVSAFAPDIERIEPSDFPQGGTYHGLAAVTAHIVKARSTWAEGTCEPQRFLVAPSGDCIIALVDVHVRLKHETQWREGRTADAFTFRNGKVIQFRTFFDERQAFEWAGMNAPAAD